MDIATYSYNDDQLPCAETCLPLPTPVKSSALLKWWTARIARGGYQLSLYICSNALHRLLIIVKRYTGTQMSHFCLSSILHAFSGDILNFGLAKEQYAAAHPERAPKVKVLVVGDDVSVGRTQGALVGRRGLAGTVLGQLQSLQYSLESAF